MNVHARYHNLYTDGQTLIEAIIAVSVVVLLVTGLIVGTTVSLKSLRRGRSRDQAVKLADEGLEYMRTVRNQNWTDFIGYNGTYCFNPVDTNPLVATSDETCANQTSTTDTVFTRLLSFSLSGNRMMVTSKVLYYEGEKREAVELTTYMTKWK